jgi:hypothetical protein
MYNIVAGPDMLLLGINSMVPLLGGNLLYTAKSKPGDAVDGLLRDERRAFRKGNTRLYNDLCNS